MKAHFRVALNAQVPQEEQAARDLANFEHVTLEGEGDTWAAAKAAIQIPDGAVVLAEARWPI